MLVKYMVGLLVALALVPAAVRAQDPDFAGLDTADKKDLAALVQSLVKRVAELERRVDALESGQAKLAGDTEAKADPEAAKLLAAALAAKGKLVAHLDGTEVSRPKDSRLRQSRVKSSEKWETVEADAKAFVEALKGAVGHAAGLGDGKASLEALIKWARGRSVFQVRRVLDAKEYLLAPLDFASDVVAVETK